MKTENAFTNRESALRTANVPCLFSVPSTGEHISIKEARKLLGKEYAPLSDDEVDRIIKLLSFIAADFVYSSVPKSD